MARKQGQVPALASPYFSFRDKIAIHDGLLLRGNRVIVLHSMRAEMKTKLHSSHVGIEACLRRARGCLYWPNMSQEIRDYVSTCTICAELGTAQTKETLIRHDTPDRPWSKVDADLLELNKTEYLVIVDYFSNFGEINRLDNASAKTVIRKMKSHFSHYGIPECLINDNSPPFQSEEFPKFAEEWDFEHSPSSPGHSQSNERAGSAVKSAKKMLIKTQEAGTDPYLALLDLRNTPAQDSGFSPVQKLLGQRTRTLLPATTKLLTPDVVPGNALMQLAKTTQLRQAKYYNRGAKDLPVLEEGDAVRLKPFQRTRHLLKGTVSKCLAKRSYEVETDSGWILRRNCVYLRKSLENQKPATDTPQKAPELPQNETNTSPPECGVIPKAMPATPVKRITRSREAMPATPVMRMSRVLYTPFRYRDKICGRHLYGSSRSAAILVLGLV